MCPASWPIKGFYAIILALQGQSLATFFVIVVDITLTTRQHSTIGMHIVSFDICLFAVGNGKRSF
jgi:hypothetical protein